MTDDDSKRVAEMRRSDRAQYPANVRILLRALDAAEKRAEEAETRLEEHEGAMHLRVRGEYDRTIADCWRAKVAELEGEIERLRAAGDALRDAAQAAYNDATAEYYALADTIDAWDAARGPR